MGDHLERTPERKDMGVTQPGWCWPTLPQPREQQPRAQEGGGVARRGVARTGREGQASAPWEGNSCWDSGAGCLPILPQLGARLSRSGADTRAAAAAAAVVAASGFGWTRWGLLLWAQEPRRAGTGAGAQEKFTFSGCEEPRGGSGCCQVSTRLATAPGATLSFTAPPTPITTLESRPTHPDSCPRAPTHGPADLSSGLPSPPSASLGPERLDPLRQALADEGLDSQALGSPEGAGTLDSEPLLGATATAPPCARPTGENEDEEQGGQREEECPICTEPYGPGEHRLAQLNCGHSLCSGCLHRLLDMAPSADLGRVRCPLCRQKTPMLEWEICRLQEELLLADGPQRPPPPTPPTPPRRGPGPWASLEHHYQLRFLAGPVGGRGCLPFLPCPPCLGTRLWALRERGPCARRLGLLGLLGLELLGLLLTFTPLVLLGLLFMLLDRSGH